MEVTESLLYLLSLCQTEHRVVRYTSSWHAQQYCNNHTNLNACAYHAVRDASMADYVGVPHEILCQVFSKAL